MPEAISIILLNDGAPAPVVARALEILHAQTIQDWQCVLVGPGPVPPGPDPRTRHIPATGRRPALLNQAIDAASGPFLLFLDPLDAIEPGAMDDLLTAAGQNEVAGSIGSYRFSSPIGEIPGDPLAGAPTRIGWEHLIRASPFPMHAMLLSRAALGALRFRTDLDAAWDYDLWLRIAESGATWARADRITAHYAMRPLTADPATLRALASHIRVASESLIRTGRAADTREFTSDYTDALLLLRAHRYAIEQRGPGHLAAATRFPALFAQWWQRLGFYGNPPRHILAANGGAAEAVSSDLIARRLVDACDAPPVLLGLGKNARQIARHLHDRRIPVRGRDDSLAAPPAWSIEDGIPVDLIPRDALYDPQHPYIMTVLHDAGYLSSLPPGLCIHRWAAMPDLILSEWRDSILAQALPPAGTKARPAETASARL